MSIYMSPIVYTVDLFAEPEVRHSAMARCVTILGCFLASVSALGGVSSVVMLRCGIFQNGQPFGTSPGGALEAGSLKGEAGIKGW